MQRSPDNNRSPAIQYIKKKKLPVPADLQYNYDSSLRYRFTSPSLVGTFGTVRANFSGDDAVR